VETTVNAVLTVVRGEMRPWSDEPGPGGALLREVADRLVAGRARPRVLVVGPHGQDVLEELVELGAQVTTLLRSFSDAEQIAAALPAVDVVAGALDGLAARGDAPFDVVLAADGLDRLLGTDSPDLDWQARLRLLVGLRAADGVLLLALDNPLSLASLLDRRLPHERYGDTEWVPLHSDPSRPASAGAFLGALGAAGVVDVRGHAVVPVAGSPVAVIELEQAAQVRPGTPVALALQGALGEAAAEVPLLAPVDEAAVLAVRAGQLAAVAPQWWAVSGPEFPALVIDGGTAGLFVGTPSEIHSAGGGPAVQLPTTTCVRDQLLALAEAEDVPGFRQLAEQLGSWLLEDTDGLWRWDDVWPGTDGFVSGVLGVRPDPSSAAEVRLVAAWWRFHDALVGARRRHPWPPWMIGAELVATWSTMSGVAPSAELLDEARAIAGGAPDLGLDVRSLQTELEARELELKELRGQVFGLERALGFRDQQLRVREERIRALRTRVREVEAQSSPIMLALVRRLRLLRQPRKVAGAVKRRVRRRLRALRK
jgi:hypothetical protein